MDHYSGFSHIDFCYRTSPHNVPRSNNPKGYWFITEVIVANMAVIWKKCEKGKWVRLSSSYMPFEENAEERGSIIKIGDTIYASGDLHKRLDSMLLEHMEKMGKNQSPYNYWYK